MVNGDFELEALNGSNYYSHYRRKLMNFNWKFRQNKIGEIILT
jgi:hypothetical protein